MFPRNSILPPILRAALAIACAAPARLATGAESPPWIVRSYDTEHGLPGARVLSIGQSADGYVWVGTNGGVARFDGVRFTPIPGGPEKMPGDGNVTALVNGADGRLFFAMQDGRSGEVAAGEWRVRAAAKAGVQVACMLPNPGGDVWLGQMSNGILRLGPAGAEVFKEKEGVPAGAVTALIRDGQGTAWALVGNHLLRWKDGRWTAAAAASPAAQSVDAITPARDGGIWLATASSKRGGISDRPGIWRQHDGEEVQWHSDLPAEDPGYYAERIAVLHEDRHGQLWCAVRGGGLFCQTAAGAWQAVGTRDMLGRITSLFEDREGVLWASTEATGLCRIAQRLVAELRAPAEIAQPIFWTVCATRDGAVWGGTDGAGVFRWAPDGSAEVFNQANGLPAGQVPCLLEDRTGTLWAGTRNGLVQFHDGQFVPPSVSDAALRTRITALHEAPDGTLWAGTEKGLAALRDGEVKLYAAAAGLPADRIRSIQTGAGGVIHVVVQDRGLFRQKAADSFELVAGWTQGAAGRSICADPAGPLWLTTTGRWLFRYAAGRFDRIASEQGVPNHNVQGAVADALGNIWFASDLGIFGTSAASLRSYDPNAGGQLSFWILLGAQGLPNKASTGIGGPVGSLAPDGRVWFANGSAVAGVNPALLPASGRVHVPVFEGCSAAGVLQEAEQSSPIRVRNRTVPLDFHFTSPETFFPERLRFRVWLEGRDAAWVPVGQRRTVSYPNLEPGSYRFRVAVSAPGGEWIEASAIPRIEIVPLFFERRSTRVALAAAAIAAAALLAWRVEHARNQRRLARAATQRALDAERQRIARDLHDELGAGLTDIIFAGDHLAEDLSAAPQLQPEAERIATRARELASAIEEVVWSIDPAEDTLASFLLRFQRTAQEHLGHAGIHFRWDAPPDVPARHLPVRVRHALLMAGKETITNALKHAGAREVRVRVRFDEPPGGFTLAIEDDGCGFDSALPRERGYGLGGLRSRLTECGGVCQLDTAPGAGTRVEFRIPSPALLPA